MNDFWERPDLCALVGSRLYGINTPESDYDYRGFVIEPSEYLIGLNRFDQHNDPTTDKIIYSLRKFLTLIQGGNINVIECLYSKEFKNKSHAATRIINSRQKFLSKSLYKNVKGYAYAEFSRAKGISKTCKFDNPEDYNLWENLRSRYQLTRVDVDEMMDKIFEDREKDPRVEEKKLVDVGAKRLALIQKHGYDVKSAANCIRLIAQGIEILLDQTITFPRPEKDLLLGIRHGLIKLPDLEKVFAEYMEKLEEAKVKTKLPKTTDFDLVNRMYMNFVRDALSD